MEINHFTPSFDIEQSFQGVIAGVDEVGYGAWAGPVMAAAVVLSYNCDSFLLDQLNDSKKLSKTHRERVFDSLQKSPHAFIGVGQASVEEIDNINIRQAALLAMNRAIINLSLPLDAVIIDGTAKPACSYPCYSYIKGDQRSYSIAAASIVAKVIRDRLMQELSLEHPHFGWEKNVGYGTQSHSKALLSHGPTLWHRKSYKPIAALLSEPIG